MSTQTVDVITRDMEGVITFEKKGIIAPANWSMRAITVVAINYLHEHEYSIPDVIQEIVATIFDNDPNNVEQYFPDIRTKLVVLITNQMGSFNSPVWFNFRKDSKRLQGSGCYIFHRKDDMADIFKKTTYEAEVFHYGSGVGYDLSEIREEGSPIAGGGKASGPLSFMLPPDAWAKSVKSGGKTRRAAKYVGLFDNHPNSGKFLGYKANEEHKAKTLMQGDPEKYKGNSFVNEAYATVAGQNANLSMNTSDLFMKTATGQFINPLFDLLSRDPKKFMEKVGHINASDRLDALSKYAWETGDPGLVFRDTINKMNMVIKDEEIVSPNPCFAGSTLINTSQGVFPIETLDGQTKDILHANGAYAKAKFFKTGIKPVYRVTLSGGLYLECTPDHRWETSEVTWVEAKDLMGSKIKWSESTPPLDQLNQSNPQDTLKATIAGFLLGDGVFRHTNTCDTIDIKFSSKDEEIQSLIKPFIGKTPTKNLSSVKLLTIFREFKIDETVNYKRSFPTTAYKNPLAFLKGLYSANGSVVDSKYPRVTLKSINTKIIEGTQKLLASLGIKAYVTTNKPKEIQFPNGVYTTKESFDLNISGQGVPLFAKYIGFIQTYKNDKLTTYLNMHRDRVFKPKLMDVKSIQYIGDQEVYDFTILNGEDPFGIICGVKVHNCGEFMGVNDSSCNLASLNLLAFLKEDGTFDDESFKDAVEVFIVAMDIIATIGWYPYPEMVEKTHKYRPLGLGFANLGGYLMSRGMPYDSPAGRHTASILTSILTKAAWKTSFDLSELLGSPLSYKKYGEDAMRVIALQTGYTGLDNPPAYKKHVMDLFALVKPLMPRNTQVSLMAPTGTIGFMMDVDSTGIEPMVASFAIKTLVSGEQMVMIPDSILTLLVRKGYSKEEAITHLETYNTLKGFIKKEEYKVFQCALDENSPELVISPQGHLLMQAAIQKNISSAISKTINLPENTTWQEIREIYIQAWELGCKGITVFRNNCKAFQPVNTVKKTTVGEVFASPDTPTDPSRIKPENDVLSYRHRFEVGGHKGYLTIGCYQDGSICEIFATITNHGSTLTGFLDAWAKQVSLSLQYGVPLESVIKLHSGSIFEPRGFTTHDTLHMTTSIVDYVVKFLDLFYKNPNKYLNRLIEVHHTGADDSEEVDLEEEIEITTEITKQQPIVIDHRETMICGQCGNVMSRPPGLSCFYCQTCGTSNGCS